MSDMHFTPFVPSSGPLAGAVDLMFVLERYNPEHKLERLVPNGRVTLVIELDGRPRFVYDNGTREPIQECRDAWLSGVHTGYLTLGEVGPDSRLCAIQFAPGRALPFVHRSLEDFNERVAPGVEAFGASLPALRRSLLALTDPLKVLERLVEELEDRYDVELEAPPIVRGSLERMSAGGEALRLTRHVEEVGEMSYKHFVHLFKRHAGPGPKVMQRILRFLQVFEALNRQESVDWAALSLELGYADQSHFIRDFRAFSGYRPQTFLESGQERMNFFPDDLP